MFETLNSCQYIFILQINNEFVEHLKPYVNIINVCPEMSLGLKVPRDTLRVVLQNDELRLYQPKTEKVKI